MRYWISIADYTLLLDSLDLAKDKRLFIKLIRDYIEVIPVYKIIEVCTKAQMKLVDLDFQGVLDVLWKFCSS